MTHKCAGGRPKNDGRESALPDIPRMYIWQEYPEFFRGLSRVMHEARRSTIRRTGRARPRPTTRVCESAGRYRGDNGDSAGKPRPLALVTRRAATGTLITPHSRAALTGARARQSGRAFEQEIELTNAVYERRELAVIYRHHPTIEGWGRTLRVVGRGPADFSGVARLGTASVAVAFDCKVITGQASYRHAVRDLHQIESLRRFRAAGGVAFLLLHCRTLDRLWMLTDLNALLRGQRIEVHQRRLEGDALDTLPALRRTSILDSARDHRPPWDYLSLVAKTQSAL